MKKTTPVSRKKAQKVAPAPPAPTQIDLTSPETISGLKTISFLPSQVIIHKQELVELLGLIQILATEVEALRGQLNISINKAG